MGRSFLPRFILWLAREILLHFALALPGLCLIRLATLGRWPRGAEPKGARGGAWYPASVAAGTILWVAILGLAIWKFRD